MQVSTSPVEKERRYIIILGSLMSGLGKGIVTASVGKELQSKGFKVVPVKFDGYLNVDCGTMNPYRHGEVFVLDDGAECDMDLGTYERFLNIDLKWDNNITGGKIFRLIIEKERKGGYLGYDVQIVPHLTDEIKKWVKKVGGDFDADVVLVEVGGTVGDLENSYFIEAMRQLALESKNSTMFIQVTYVPTLESVGEQKTKPTQHATRLLQSMGVQPDIIACRGVGKLSANARKKIALFCNVPEEAVITDPDCETIYKVPILFENQMFSELIMQKLCMKSAKKDLKSWEGLVEKITNPKKNVTIGITGKYTALKDAYVSIKEAIIHAGAHNDCRANIKWIETTEIEDGKQKVDVLKECDGIIVPGGFGERGMEGKIQCIKYARENNLPFLGLCLGMQLAVVEYARNVCGLEGANTTESDPNTKYPVVDFLPEQKRIVYKGATMRLGGHDVQIKEGTLAHKLYGSTKARERFRHRWEINEKYVKTLEEKGLVFSGKAVGEDVMQIAELPGHKFFLGTQFHPEFTSRLERPNPLFMGFLKACMK
ncbi:MAG: CTP synthase (glutamine hydrolyzing) [Candidatus Micrarchaeota archaeon]|nr:CTP synthase (glutamine hydrolyzing) [Candidatus Micrarchaeota archaeon]